MIIPGLVEILEPLATDGVKLDLSTSGFGLEGDKIAQVAALFDQIRVSIDAPQPGLNDAIRGQPGAYAQAVAAVRQLVRCSDNVIVDATLIRTSFPHVEAFVRDFLPMIPGLKAVHFNPACPWGCAARQSFRGELVSDDQLAMLRDGSFVTHLQSMAPSGVTVSVTDNWHLVMRPEDVESGRASSCMYVEPDGLVRATPGYQGTVGNLLTDDPRLLWRRVQEHWHHPLLVERLAHVNTMAEWADAALAIDHYLASSDELERRSRRKQFHGLTLSAESRKIGKLRVLD